jgi:hypothetical protein
MSLKKSNLKKADNAKLKQIADIALYSLLLLQPVIATMPVDDKVQKWIGVALSVIVIGFKAITKFTTNEEVVINSDNTPTGV